MTTKTLAQGTTDTRSSDNLFSIIVQPINDIATAIEKGNYTGVYELISSDHSRIPLQETVGAKRVYFVPVIEDVHIGNEEAYVNTFGLTLCKKAPNYLLGAMASLPENEIPTELQGKDFVAAENETSSVFALKNNNRCFLRVIRKNGKRILYLVRLHRSLNTSYGWVFLAEKPQ